MAILETINAQCCAQTAFNFKENKEQRVGHVLKMGFPGSGKELTGDITVYDPENPTSEVKVVAIIDHISWDGDEGSPLQVSGRVSPANRGLMHQALSARNGGSDITIDFIVQQYDNAAKKYFRRFHTDGTPLKCEITKGTKAYLNEDVDLSIPEPKNCTFSITLSPKSNDGKQKVCVATNMSDKWSLDIGTVSTGG